MRSVVQEIHDFDNSSMIFRYPFDKDYKEMQLIGDKERNFAIDYIAIKQNFNTVFDRLLGCFHVIYDRYENLDITPIIYRFHVVYSHY